MEIIEAIRRRRSIRSFKPEPVPREILEELLDACRWAPSARNAQPWRFAVLGGEFFKQVKNRLEEKANASWDGKDYRDVDPDFPRTAPHPESYVRQAKAIREALQAAVLSADGSDNEEKIEALRATRLRFCDAPNAIVIYTDDRCPTVLNGIGIVAQSICLGALAYELGTCIMGLTVRWPELYREMLDIPADMPIAISIAIGYPEPNLKLNNFTRTREPLETMTRWYGL